MMRYVSKMILVGLLPVSIVGSLVAAVYDIDPVHSQVGFRIRHIVSKVRGSFNTFSGTVTYDSAKPGDTTAIVTIKADSIDTANEKRDDHLKGADFFNVEKYPELIFKSTKVKSMGKDKIKVAGNLTMLGVPKPVELDVEIGGIGNDPWGNTRVGFSAQGELNRKDYGMVFNIALDQGGFVIGDEVEILIELEGIQQKK